jgi:hypothetical protein
VLHRRGLRWQVAMTEAPAEPTAKTYRERAKQARAEAATAASSRSKRGWYEIADDCERRAGFVEHATAVRATPTG